MRKLVEMRMEWLSHARPNQIVPENEDGWNIFLANAGRGWGKTCTGAHDFAWYFGTHERHRGAIIAPTFPDARDTCVEGESGLESILPHECIKAWNRSIGEFELWNGSYIKCFSSDAPERLRGPQFHRAWGDEVASWDLGSQKEVLPGQEGIPPAWTQLRFTLRLGRKQGLRPKTILTTTPKPVTLILRLLEGSLGAVYLVTGSTFENEANLAEDFLQELKDTYGGTRAGQQELYAQILLKVDGALWSTDMLEMSRVKKTPALRRIIVAIDPPASDGKSTKAAEAGIMVGGVSYDNHGYLLYDGSLRGSPERWGSEAVKLVDRFGARGIVAEGNNGGDMVRAVIHGVDDTIPVKIVHASRGKLIRAEPVSALYEQSKVHHLGMFPALEKQLTTWLPGQASPDRMDALVWLITDLLLAHRSRRLTGIKGTKQYSPYSV